MKRSTKVGSRGSRFAAVLLASGLVVAACGGDGDAEGDGSESEATEAPVGSEAPAESTGSTGSTDSSASTDSAAPTEGGLASDALGAPTGEEIVIGMVNTEGGAGGLDFPDIRRFLEAGVAYANEHGGLGNRPVQFIGCTVKGDPETSQFCAQELVGQGVELVLVGLDLFIDYKTFDAAGVPVIGVLPIMPTDYTANALFLTGGNATSQSASAVFARDQLGASRVAIIHADNPGANSTAAGLQAALDKGGIEWTAVKGGNDETDAGFQGLMRQASDFDPDVIVSLYSDAGCIGTMRARASLGIETPVVTTAICADDDVIDVVGDDATGWYFAGLPPDSDTPERDLLVKLLAPVIGVPEEEVSPTGLGLGGLGYTMWMSLYDYGQKMVAEGIEVTGPSLFDFLKTSDDLFLFGGQTPIACGSEPTYPAVCSFVFPFAMYKGDGVVGPVDGVDLVDSRPLLP